jgi:hypothetical protein
MNRHLALAVALLLVPLTRAQQIAVYRVDQKPELAWVFESVHKLKLAGVADGFPDGYHWRRVLTNRDVASGVHGTVEFLSRFLQAVETDFRQLSLADPSDPKALRLRAQYEEKDLGLIRSFKPALLELERLRLLVKQELASMGSQVATMTGVDVIFSKRIDRLMLPEIGSKRNATFRDVPANHWAAGAIENLRLKGILNGYPNGLFIGEPTPPFKFLSGRQPVHSSATTLSYTFRGDYDQLATSATAELNGRGYTTRTVELYPHEPGRARYLLAIGRDGSEVWIWRNTNVGSGSNIGMHPGWLTATIRTRR